MMLSQKLRMLILNQVILSGEQVRSSGFISNLRPTRVRSQFVDNIAVFDFPRILATAFSYNAVINILGRLISNRPFQKTGVMSPTLQCCQQILLPTTSVTKVGVAL